MLRVASMVGRIVPSGPAVVPRQVRRRNRADHFRSAHSYLSVTIPPAQPIRVGCELFHPGLSHLLRADTPLDLSVIEPARMIVGELPLETLSS